MALAIIEESLCPFGCVPCLRGDVECGDCIPCGYAWAAENFSSVEPQDNLSCGEESE
jgi:hypothetical protein